MVGNALTITGGGHCAVGVMLRIQLSKLSFLRTPTRQRQMWYEGGAVCATAAIGIAMMLGSAPPSHAERGTTAPAIAKASAPTAAIAPAGKAPPAVEPISRTAAPEAPPAVAKAPPAVAKLPPADVEAQPAAPEAQPAAPEPPPADIERMVRIKRGDTFMQVLRSAGANRPDAAKAIAAMRKVYDPRGLMPGQNVTVILRREAATKKAAQLMGFVFDSGLERTVRVARSADDAFTVSVIKKNLARRHKRTGGTIKSSLYRAGTAAGLPLPVLIDLIRLFSWDVDFQRDIQPGDGFDVLFERFHLADGAVAREGDILFAELRLSGVPHRLYRFKVAKRRAEYFDRNGRSARRALMKTPIDGARLSSGYGRRRHPILGYTRMHRGIDFAASRGTPIYAAGDGVIVRAGRNGAYGKYVRIRHNGRYSTAYAHMRGYARGLRRGRRVRQGQIIGYVGSTGRSTGPHLHYEVLVQNRRVNPFRIRMPSGRRLSGREMKAFRTVRSGIDNRLAGMPPKTKVTRK